MFGFFKKRVAKEQAKLVYQNYMASTYIETFDPEIAQIAKRQIESIHLIWQVGKSMDPSIVESLMSTNKSLRTAYDQTPGRYFKKFDDEFVPLLGWDEWYQTKLEMRDV